LEVVLLDARQEEIVGIGMRNGLLNVHPLRVLGRDKVQSLITRRVRAGFEKPVELRLPDHIAAAVANREQKFHNIWGEGCDIEHERTDLGDVCSQRAVNAGALNAEEYAEIDAAPVDLVLGGAVGAEFIAFVSGAYAHEKG
jgi:hypothetical protein